MPKLQMILCYVFEAAIGTALFILLALVVIEASKQYRWNIGD